MFRCFILTPPPKKKKYKIKIEKPQRKTKESENM